MENGDNRLLSLVTEEKMEEEEEVEEELNKEQRKGGRAGGRKGGREGLGSEHGGTWLHTEFPALSRRQWEDVMIQAVLAFSVNE